MRGMGSKKVGGQQKKVVKKQKQPHKSKKAVIRHIEPRRQPRKINRRRRKSLETIKVTRLSPYDRVKVGERWYVVHHTRMIGRKSDKRSICIVHTVEKGGMYFRSTAKVLMADPDTEI